MYCLWPLPFLLLVCTTLVCVLFVATPTSTISVFYFSICTLLKYVYCLWPLPRLLFMCTTLVLFVCNTLVLSVCCTLVLSVGSTLVLFVCRTIVLVCTISLKLYLEETRVPG